MSSPNRPRIWSRPIDVGVVERVDQLGVVARREPQLGVGGRLPAVTELGDQGERLLDAGGVVGDAGERGGDLVDALTHRQVLGGRGEHRVLGPEVVELRAAGQARAAGHLGGGRRRVAGLGQGVDDGVEQPDPRLGHALGCRLCWSSAARHSPFRGCGCDSAALHVQYLHVQVGTCRVRASGPRRRRAPGTIGSPIGARRDVVRLARGVADLDRRGARGRDHVRRVRR